MNANRKALTLKKIAAAALAVTLSLSAFGMSESGKTSQQSVQITTAAADDDENAAYEKQLQELENKKAELDKKIADAGSDIKGQQEKLDAVNEKAATIKKKIDKLAAKTSELENDMCDLDAEMRSTRYELEQSEADIAEGLTEFKDRLRAMYVAGSGTYPEVLLASESFYDVLMRIELVKRVAEHDNETMDALLEKKAKIEAYQAELDEQSSKLKKKSAEYSSKQQDLIKQQTELLMLKQEYGDKIKSLQGDISSYTDQAALINDEYNKVSEKAKTTTTTTVTTAKPETSESDEKSTTTKKTDKDDDTGTGKTTTTKKGKNDDSEPEVTSDTEKTTTTTVKTTEPEVTEEPHTTSTQPPVTTTNTTTTERPTNTTTAEPEPEPEPEPDPYDSDRETKISIIVNYAKGMVGGSYVWAGEQYGATDCSGLVMLSYRQIGIYLPHYAASQAEYGTNVSYSDLQPGDLVFFGGSSYSSIYHVAMYIGDGKIVHAESTATGIVISYLSSVAQYNSITCMKRLI